MGDVLQYYGLQQYLNFLPLPQGQGSLRLILKGLRYGSCFSLLWRRLRLSAIPSAELIYRHSREVILKLVCIVSSKLRKNYTSQTITYYKQ